MTTIKKFKNLLKSKLIYLVYVMSMLGRFILSSVGIYNFWVDLLCITISIVVLLGYISIITVGITKHKQATNKSKVVTMKYRDWMFNLCNISKFESNKLLDASLNGIIVMILLVSIMRFYI